MKFEKWLMGSSLKDKKLDYKLKIIFGLFFLFPVFGFIIFAVKYDILHDEYLPLFFLGVLVFSFLGFFMLRRLFDQIINISKSISNSTITKLSGEQPKNGINELNRILQSFTSIENQFSNTFKKLENKASQISILKELSDICSATFDPEEILYVALERSLIVTNADTGSILILEKSNSKSFVVRASIGRGEFVKIGDKIDFETSIAKYAVINKSPIVVENIEKDTRFGRISHSNYKTKSFICMPIKTSKDIVGVLTISRKDNDKVFTHEDLEALTPLLSNAAFTYENLRLLKENEQKEQYLKSIDKIFKVINSSFRNSEFLHAFLNEVQGAVPFDLAVVMIKNEDKPGYITIFDLLTNKPTNISKGTPYAYQGSIIDKILKQGTTMFVNDTSTLTNAVERELLTNQKYNSCIFTPLKIEGVVKGILLLAAKEPDIFYVPQNFIEWISNGLSLAIERNNLSATVFKRAQELDTVRQIGSALASSTFDISKVLQYTMDMIRVAINVEAASLYLLDKDELELAVSFNIDVDTLKKFRIKIGQGTAGYAAARGESIIVNGVQELPRFYPEIDKFTGFKTRSALCVPMISQGKVIGVLEVLNKMEGDFVESDKDLLQSIASSVSVAMENARLYKETLSMADHERGIRNMFQKFVPKEVLDRIIHDTEAGKEMIAEFKTLTMLNIDIRGFSKLAINIGPHKTVSLLNHFFSTMGGIVFKHHGIIDKYLGDGFLAIFGAPVSSIRDADNAVSAALEIRNSLEAVNSYFGKELGVSVTIGTSIHTGEVVVGNIGFEMKMDYTAIGDPVNAVFRIQDLTKSSPNSILISEKTYRATQSPLEIREICASCDLDSALGTLKIYELLGYKQG